MAIFNHHCNFGRLFKTNSMLCEPFRPIAPTPCANPLQVTHDLEEEPPISMEAKMQELEDKMEEVARSSTMRRRFSVMFSGELRAMLLIRLEKPMSWIGTS